MAFSEPVFLNRQAAAWYRALASIIPGPRIIKKNLPGYGLTKIENHSSKQITHVYFLKEDLKVIIIMLRT
jgi:hypothetical protein